MILTDYAASYGGNFIESILELEKVSKKSGYRLSYAFPSEAREYEWTKRLGTVPVFFNWNVGSMRDTLLPLFKEGNVNLIHYHFVGIKKALMIKGALGFLGG